MKKLLLLSILTTVAFCSEETEPKESPLHTMFKTRLKLAEYAANKTIGEYIEVATPEFKLKVLEFYTQTLQKKGVAVDWSRPEFKPAADFLFSILSSSGFMANSFVQPAEWAKILTAKDVSTGEKGNRYTFLDLGHTDTATYKISNAVTTLALIPTIPFWIAQGAASDFYIKSLADDTTDRMLAWSKVVAFTGDGF
jgi:hypothetical protein